MKQEITMAECEKETEKFPSQSVKTGEIPMAEREIEIPWYSVNRKNPHGRVSK